MNLGKISILIYAKYITTITSNLYMFHLFKWGTKDRQTTIIVQDAFQYPILFFILFDFPFLTLFNVCQMENGIFFLYSNIISLPSTCSKGIFLFLFLVFLNSILFVCVCLCCFCFLLKGGWRQWWRRWLWKYS